MNWFMRILENSTTTDMLGTNDDMDTRSYGFLISLNSCSLRYL